MNLHPASRPAKPRSKSASSRRAACAVSERKSSMDHDASDEPLMDDRHLLGSPEFAPKMKFDTHVPLPTHASSYQLDMYSGRQARPLSQRQLSQSAVPRTMPQPSSYGRESSDYIGFSGSPSPLPRDESSTASLSDASTAPTTHTLPMLQTKGPPNEHDTFETVNVDDPSSFDLLESVPETTQPVYQLETRSEQVFSAEHLHYIFKDSKLLLQFTGFLSSHRPKSVRTLDYYLNALKALRAIEYANSVADALPPIAEHQFTRRACDKTVNAALQEKAEKAFELLVKNDLPAWVTFTWTQLASASIQRRVTGTLAPHLREASEGLAEVFCLSDPNRPDNPLVFSSEEFQRMTQYGLNYCIGRNCRFLSGPGTERSSVERLAQAVKAGKEHSEILLNYRRDGQPFMNLLMIAPLLDSQGRIRYYIGAQIDISGLAKDCTALEGLRRLVARHADPALARSQDAEENRKDAFQKLNENFTTYELESVRKHGGSVHREQFEDDDDGASIASHRPRLLLSDPSGDALDKSTQGMPHAQAVATKEDIHANGRLQGVYQHYLLVRPSESLRILFTSPSLRIPGILQSSLISRIGGSTRVRSELVQAFHEGRGVTAKVKWLTRARDENVDRTGMDEEGRSRWLHCTPLLGHNGKIGVWMVVLVDDEDSAGIVNRRFRPAPPVAPHVQSRDVAEIGLANVARSYRAIRPTSGVSEYGTHNSNTAQAAQASHGPHASGADMRPSRSRPDLSGKQTADAQRRRSSVGTADLLEQAETSRPQSELSFALR